MTTNNPFPEPSRDSLIGTVIRFCMQNRLVVVLVMVLIVFWGLKVSPFDSTLPFVTRDPVPVDAIPDIGENQQIVFTEWMGRSPQDIEDQISYPLTAALSGIAGVRTIRTSSMFGFSAIYVIFEEDVEFYWSRSRILEKLNSLPTGTLPDGVQPALGPDATGLGQVFWYTLEGQNEAGEPTGGWDLDELRSIQDWQVRYALMSATGVAEVASIGGHVREYQVDVDPDAMRAHGVTLSQVSAAVRMSNLDVGARSLEINSVEYFIRGLGFIQSLSDIENSVISVAGNVPIYVKDVATVGTGPGPRRGALDKEGAEVVGGVVVVRYGANPLIAISSMKDRIAAIADGLPERAVVDFRSATRLEVEAFAEEQGFVAFTDHALDQAAWLTWLRTHDSGERPAWLDYSRVTIEPFYDRSKLIKETLMTLKTAIWQEVLITIIVVLLMVRHLQSSLLIAGLLPLAVLMTFIAMRYTGVDANIVALSGIAIAIGTMVDMAVIICENILRKLRESDASESRFSVIYRATKEVGSAVLTAVATTVVGFLPVFVLVGEAGKLFRPLAFTKTYALLAAIIVSLTIIPAMAYLLFRRGHLKPQAGEPATGAKRSKENLVIYGIVLVVMVLLSNDWLPLGPEKGGVVNFVFVAGLIGVVLGFLTCFRRGYGRVLEWALNHKGLFMSIPLVMLLAGGSAGLGFKWELMPSLNEGSYLFMPSTMQHASISEALDVLQKQDIAMKQIPEVEKVVGKLGRVDSPLDPAPVSMFETMVNYKTMYITDDEGRRLRYRLDSSTNDLFRDREGSPILAPDGKPYTVPGTFERDGSGRLIPDRSGIPFRQWRPRIDLSLNPGREMWGGINDPDDIWKEISRLTEMPGVTVAPKLQPIETRLLMLQTGMRSPLGIKIQGPDLETLERFGLELETRLKEVVGVDPASVFADRMVGKPYLEISIDRKAIARYGIHLERVQRVIEMAVGGMTLTHTVEGRERYAVRVRYQRELRDSIEGLSRISVSTASGAQVPLTQLAEIGYSRGPQVIKSEDSFLTGYVTFGKEDGMTEREVVEKSQAYLEGLHASGDLVVPAGVEYRFAGAYENSVRTRQAFMEILPVALIVIFIILYLQFRSKTTATLVFSGIIVAWTGGFLLLWLYGQPWFMDFSLFGTNMRDLFRVQEISLSTAVMVGFLALFGIASDDGVLMGTMLTQVFDRDKPADVQKIRSCVLEGAQLRVRPALMTSATTILALLPILTSAGRGADIMIPMAIPCFGGMIVAVVTVLVVPVLYCWVQEVKLKLDNKEPSVHL